MSETSPHVIEATAENFEREVIERSRKVPVLVDFWAEWCGPCRMLGPVLERLAAEYDGEFALVKVDTEALPEYASGFGVRGIPAVFALRDGKIAGEFVGVQPEASIREFIDRLLPTPGERLVAEAQHLEPTDRDAAEAKYREAIGLEPQLLAARIGLARVRLAAGDAGEGQRLIAELERRGYLEPEAETLKAELTLHEGAESVGGVEEARAAAAAKPEDLRLRLRLAEALAAAGQYPEALEICLDLVERDRKGVGESARQTMLAVFQLLPPDSELVSDFRRRLSFVL